MGTRALLVDDVDDPIAVALALDRCDQQFIDIVPAARTVLVTVGSADDLAVARTTISNLVVADDTPDSREAVTIDVRYDGADLGTIAEAVGMSVDDVIVAHSSASYRVAFCGFAPGFGYLTGLPEVLHIARRDTPRLRVPAGSVAIASEYAAVYPTESPGGWHLLGSTDLDLFDADRTPPALLTPGTMVEFRRS